MTAITPPSAGNARQGFLDPNRDARAVCRPMAGREAFPGRFGISSRVRSAPFAIWSA
jgi:hypothetical protein